MELPSQIDEFLKQAITLDNLILPYFYAKANDIENFQLGYKVNAVTGENLTGNTSGDFKENWYVVCSNYFNDPYFVDFTEEAIGFPVYYSQHGAGEWISIKIADTIDSFISILTDLKQLENDKNATLNYIKTNLDISNELWSEAYSSVEEEEEEEE